MCIRFSQRSEEVLGLQLLFSASSLEPGTLDLTLYFSASSTELLSSERVFSTSSLERVFTPEEYAVQFPEEDGEFEIPDQELYDSEDPESYQPTDPLAPPGLWPLRTRDLSVSSAHYIISPPSVTASIGGIDLTPYLKSYSVSESRGGSCTGSLVCRDRTGFLAEALSIFYLANQDIYPHNKTFSRKVVINAIHNGVKINYPTFIPSDPSWDEEGSVTIDFTDGTEILDLDNQTLPNIVHDEGAKGKCNETISALGTLAGVTVRSYLPDFDVRIFRFNNQNVLFGINQLIQIMQGYRVFKGDVCTVEQLNPAKNASWTFKDRFHIESLTFRIDTSNLRTFFRAFRNETQSSAVAAPLSCVGFDCVGRVVNLTFDQPVNYAIIYSSSPYGDVVDGVFFDENDRVLNQSPSNIYNNSRFKAVRWEATFKPDRYDDRYYVPQWRVWAIGGSPLSGSENYDEELAATAVEAIFGRRPEYNDMDSDLILDNETITLMLQAVVREVEWSVRQFSLRTPYLAPVRVGDFVKVKDYLFDVDEKLLVNGLNHSWSADGGFSASYDLAGKV